MSKQHFNMSREELLILAKNFSLHFLLLLFVFQTLFEQEFKIQFQTYNFRDELPERGFLLIPIKVWRFSFDDF